MTAKLAANFTAALFTLRERKEAGATGLEYAGMIMVAALIVGIVYGAINSGTVSTAISTAVNKIVNPGGGE